MLFFKQSLLLRHSWGSEKYNESKNYLKILCLLGSDENNFFCCKLYRATVVVLYCTIPKCLTFYLTSPVRCQFMQSTCSFFRIVAAAYTNIEGFFI